MSRLVERLKECYSRKGLSYRDLEKATKQVTSKGLSFSHLSNIHNGNMQPSYEALECLAVVYGTTVEWLRDGNPVVNIWPEIQSSAMLRDIGSANVPRAVRVSRILSFLNTRFPGHLRYSDIEAIMGLEDTGVIDGIIAGNSPTEGFVATLAELTGIPAKWLELGNMYPLGELGIQGISAERLQKWLTLGVRAEQAGIPVEAFEAFIKQMTITKGGA